MSLAEQFNIMVKEVMSPNVVTIEQSESVLQAKSRFHKYDVHHLPVMNKGAVVGILSSKDLLSEDIDEEQRVGEVMEPNVLFIECNANVTVAANLFLKSDFHSLPVVDHKKELIGILTTMDLIKLIAKI